MDKIIVTVLNTTKFEDILPTAKKHFRDAGYVVMYKDMYTVWNKFNPYDTYICTEQYTKLDKLP